MQVRRPQSRSAGYVKPNCSQYSKTNLKLTKEIELCNLNYDEVAALAKKTFCLITAVGPYALHGEITFKACAEAGTHYLDCTPEVPWTLEMIQKYEATAKATGACLIPQCAMESAPSDLLTWAIVAEARGKFSSQTADVVMNLHQLRYVCRFGFKKGP